MAKLKKMTAKKALELIESKLRGIDLQDLTTAERQIRAVLIEYHSDNPKKD